MIHSYKDLIVWQKSVSLVVEIYSICKLLPKEEQYVLGSQIKRSAISIPSNIAEGRRRKTRNDYRHFIQISYGSGAELETQLEIIKRLDMIDIQKILKTEDLLTEVMKMLNKMAMSLSHDSD